MYTKIQLFPAFFFSFFLFFSPFPCPSLSSACVTCSGVCPGQVDYVGQSSASLECQLCIPGAPRDAEADTPLERASSSQQLSGSAGASRREFGRCRSLSEGNAREGSTSAQLGKAPSLERWCRAGFGG